MRTWGELPSADEARRRFAEAWRPPRAVEVVPTEAALGRVLAAPIRSPEDLPAFRRALMDGFACRAADIAAPPARLRLVAEVRMGAPASIALRPGEAARVATGGMVPEGADVVVPVEQAELRDGEVEILAALAPGRHLIERGEDISAGELLLEEGARLRAPDIGALMGLGLVEVEVYRRPRVGILSTGDEVVPPERIPPFGKIRDMNSYSLAAAAEALGALPHRYGIVPDEPERLFAAAAAALAECDVLLLNGGTSVGPKDVVAAVIDRLGRPGVLVHGIDIRPGKPTVLALCDGKPVFGLPGQPVSALNTFEEFVAPVLRRMLRLPEERPRLAARLAEPVRSADGREDHVRVRLERREDGWWAIPLPGVSAMITTLVRAQGILVVPARSPGYEAGELVEVRRIE